jgi:hypothetical protein
MAVPLHVKEGKRTRKGYVGAPVKVGKRTRKGAVAVPL